MRLEERIREEVRGEDKRLEERIREEVNHAKSSERI